MLRTINLHLFRIGIHRFSTISHPKALDACYGAHWRLLRPDFHWQAVDSFQNTRLAPVETCARRAHNKEKPQKHMVSEVYILFDIHLEHHKTMFYYLFVNRLCS